MSDYSNLSDEVCHAWVGLEPPQTVDCALPAGHEGPHRGEITGARPTGDGGYQTVLVTITWDEDPTPMTTAYEKLVNAAAGAIGELEAEHRPEPAVKGRILGCVQCWPKDGSWPCVSRMVADELREVLEETA